MLWKWINSSKLNSSKSKYQGQLLPKNLEIDFEKTMLIGAKVVSIVFFNGSLQNIWSGRLILKSGLTWTCPIRFSIAPFAMKTTFTYGDICV